MNHQRDHLSAVTLPSGAVMAVGGDWSAPDNTAEIYNPGLRTWQEAGTLETGYATATALADGRVLVAGVGPRAQLTTETETFDPATRMWSPTGALARTSVYSCAARVLNGEVLLLDGLSTDAEL